MNNTIFSRISEWKNFDGLDLGLKEELFQMTDEQLFEAFYTDLEFGTGGMRGIIGPGPNRMNIYTLRSANYGYAKYLLNANQKSEKSVVIAYDCRRKSLEFAQESARVLCKYGIKVYLFDKITPTPELSYAIRYLHADGGIVITASHNPPQYNGYKIYDDSGCQLVPDLAQIVIDEIINCENPFNMELESFDNLLARKKVEIVGSKVDDTYLEQVKSISCHPDLDKSDFNVVFTALHGTSAYLGVRLLQEIGYSYTPVLEQLIPDSEFKTVKSPNPEDPKAFDLAIKYATEMKADICIATDPDADRVGLAVRHNNQYVLLNGNQTGALLIYYLVQNRKVDKKGIIFNTIVTSPLGAEIGKKYGMETISTLTGFKFIGEQAKLLETSADKMFYFGYEESYGYVVKDFVRDKDSLQALLMCSEMSCFYKKQGKTLVDVLDDIYAEYGYYIEDLENISLSGASGASRIVCILDYFRGCDGFNDSALIVIRKEDYEKQKAFNMKDKTEEKIALPKSNVIKYYLNDGSWFVLRPSGTEPKMKVYVSCNGQSKEAVERRVLEIKERVLAIINQVQ